MRSRKLALAKETLSELSPEELSAVAGGEITTLLIPSWQECPLTGAYPTLPVRDCIK